MEQDKILTRDEFLKADTVKKELVDLSPYMPGKVWVRGMSASDRDIWEDYMLSIREVEQFDESRGRARALMAVLCTVDEKGKPMFKLEDIELMRAKSSAVVDKIVSAAQRLSFVKDKDIDKAAKNS